MSAMLVGRQGLGVACSSRTQSKLFAKPQPVQSQRASIVVRVTQQSPDTKTVITKTTPGELPLPWSEKDPYKLPSSIEKVQRMLFALGWEKPWIEQIVDRTMKGMLRTTEERAKGVVDYLTSVGLKQDEICNMASISVVLLGLNPETRLKSVVDYLKRRGVPDSGIPDLVLKHPRIFEYKLSADGSELVKGRARIQVDVVPVGANGEQACAVNYFREGASFMEAPVSPVGPVRAP
ncbi:hypothetical protein CHLRE_16g651550v5 [Chlamydomonas reinhardtii]|uniref:Uncharacterized protein n=1 Tax=Chlamydomonas reinhardtii TaxID=3055 RepID=A8J9F6_CHLRE|nr:uncharacterized protein CHLRE_16g651550v5 [Chlamydomonas reinhardtii]PNW71373.1 hypothetical protein CHLRE_16g651550v5 [Chlamydomonas reinhardtii]|eukprot:XP_001698234.1 mitochondrial transcription termination factor [Chlamydomonas reinhardtii]